jgi:hypothetical protein
MMDSAHFDASDSQTSDVWFLAAPFGKVVRTCVIPSGKSLFFPLFNVECSNIEGPPFYGETAEAQAAIAQYWADHIVDLFCELDGVPLSNLDAYRVQNPQITFNAPAPWILGKNGGRGTSCGDGYFVLLAPLPAGRHTLHFGAAMLMTRANDPVDADHRWDINMTYHITVEAPEQRPP